jgi:electron transfer flavoprotein beta subunit
MRIVVCAKEVFDPDAVNSYALEGRLSIGEDGKTFTQTSIPRLMNAYDEQAIEAVLRLRDAGQDVTLVVVSVGSQNTDHLKHALSLGADEVVEVETDGAELDYHVVARVLAEYVKTSGGADLVLCGRQASDDDQGVVPALIGEHLGFPIVTIARDVQPADGKVKVVRVTPDGDEVVEASLPAVVTISNELGEPRYPTMQAKLKARKRKPTVVTLAELSLDAAALASKVELTKQFVPEVRGECEMIEGDAAAAAGALIGKLKQDAVI